MAAYFFPRRSFYSSYSFEIICSSLGGILGRKLGVPLGWRGFRRIFEFLHSVLPPRSGREPGLRESFRPPPRLAKWPASSEAVSDEVGDGRVIFVCHACEIGLNSNETFGLPRRYDWGYPFEVPVP